MDASPGPEAIGGRSAQVPPESTGCSRSRTRNAFVRCGRMGGAEARAWGCRVGQLPRPTRVLCGKPSFECISQPRGIIKSLRQRLFSPRIANRHSVGRPRCGLTKVEPPRTKDRNRPAFPRAIAHRLRLTPNAGRPRRRRLQKTERAAESEIRWPQTSDESQL